MFTVPAAIRRGAVANPPVFDGTIPPITGTEGQAITPYNASTHFTTGGAVATYSLTGTNVPWMSIDSNTGIITGTPTDDTDYTGVLVRGTNNDGFDESNPFAVTIEAAGGYTNEFVIEVTTASASTAFHYAMSAHPNCTVYWGDGQSDVITDRFDPNLTHTYADAGVYEVVVDGSCPEPAPGTGTTQALVTDLIHVGNTGITDMYRAFRSTSLTAVSATDGAGFSTCLSFEATFNLASLTSIDVSNYNTSSNTTFKSSFRSVGTFSLVGAGNLDIGALTSAESMLNSSTISTAEYDALLIGWAAQAPNINTGVLFHGGSSKYSAGAAADARNILDTTYSWTFTDGGPA
jgi:hypothetical protein